MLFSLNSKTKLIILSSVLLWCDLSASASSLINIPTPTQFFVGRRLELNSIENKLAANGEIVISGPGGIGKSQLAMQYALQKAPKYDVIWWFNSKKDLDHQFVNLAYALNSSFLVNKDKSLNLESMPLSAVVIYAKNAISTSSLKWLLIYDDVDETYDISSYLPIIMNKKIQHIIFTSRNDNHTYTKLRLNIFSNQETSCFITKTTGIDDKELIQKLGSSLGNYPIALSQSTSYIRENKISVEKYLKLVDSENSKRQLISINYEKNKYKTNKKDNIMNKSLELNIAQLEKSNPEAISILGIIALLGENNVPSNLIKDIALSHNINEEQFIQAVSTLRKHSLIEESENNEEQLYSMHDFIKTVTHISILENHSKKEEIYSSIFKTLFSYFDKPWIDAMNYVNNNYNLFRIANNTALRAYSDNIRNPNLFKLMVHLLTHNHVLFYKKNDYTMYQKIARALEEMDHSNELSLDNSSRLAYYSAAVGLDYIYSSSQLANEYEKLFENQLNHSKLSNNQELKARAFIHMAMFQNFRGNYTKANYSLEQAQTFITVDTPIQIKTQLCYIGIWINLYKGDFTKVDKYYTQFEEIKNEEIMRYPIYLYLTNLYAQAKAKSGDFKTAESIATYCYDKSKDFFQTENTNIAAEILVTLSQCYLASNQSSKAHDTITKAIALLQLEFKEDDIDFSQADANITLADIYVAQKKYKESLSKYVQVENFYNKMCKDNLSHIYDVARLYSKIVELGIKANDPGLSKTYITKLAEQFSLDHPISKSTWVYVLKHNSKILENL